MQGLVVFLQFGPTGLLRCTDAILLVNSYAHFSKINLDLIRINSKSQSDTRILWTFVFTQLFPVQSDSSDFRLDRRLR